MKILKVADLTPTSYVTVYLDGDQTVLVISTTKTEPNRGLIQGYVTTDHPHDLVVPYMQTIAGIAARFRPAPTNALFLGLGAGLLPSFFRREYPNCRTVSVEQYRTIVTIAQSYFDFQGDFVVDEATNYLKHQVAPMGFDMVVVDLFSSEPTVGPDVIARLLQPALVSRGVIIFNLLPEFTADEQLNAILKYYKSVKYLYSGRNALVIATNHNFYIPGAEAL